MTDAHSDEWRIDRLKAAVEKTGGKSELGRKLGYRDGGQIGHMVTGRRPITEKTIRKIEALPGFSGWFNGGHPRHAPPPSNPARDFKRPKPAGISDSEWAVLEDLESITSAERDSFIFQIHEAAKRARETFLELKSIFNKEKQ